MPAAKFIQHNGSGGFKEVAGVTTGGAPSADQIPALDANGKLDNTMMPSGIGADTAVIVASGTLAAGDFVNIYNNGGTVTCRKADASSASTTAHGFVLEAVADAANATVYFEGANDQVSGMVGGTVYLSTTAGGATGTAPSASGEIVQKLGVAVSATEINFEATNPIELA